MREQNNRLVRVKRNLIRKTSVLKYLEKQVEFMKMEIERLTNELDKENKGDIK